MWEPGGAYLEIDVYPGKDICHAVITDGCHRIFLRGDITFDKLEALQKRVKEAWENDSIIKIGEEFGLTRR